LTHDLIAELFPEITDDLPGWIEEGICQYTAAAVCKRNGFAAALNKIETCPDEEYGDGYRYFKRLFGTDNWAKLAKWIRETDLQQLPCRP